MSSEDEFYNYKRYRWLNRGSLESERERGSDAVRQRCFESIWQRLIRQGVHVNTASQIKPG